MWLLIVTFWVHSAKVASLATFRNEAECQAAATQVRSVTPAGTETYCRKIR